MSERIQEAIDTLENYQSWSDAAEGDDRVMSALELGKEALREKLQRENPEPLTWDCIEVGKVYWYVPLGENFVPAGWAIVKEIVLKKLARFIISSYGTPDEIGEDLDELGVTFNLYATEPKGDATCKNND